MGDSEWSRPASLKLAQENIQSRVKEEDSITDSENAVFDFGVMEPLSFLFVDQRSEGQSLHASRPSRLCAQAQLVDDMPFHCGPIKSGVKHLFGGVVWAMISFGGSTVASLENVNGFLAVYTSPDDLIRTDFEQEGVVPKVMLHIFEEFVLLLGRYSLNNKIPRMEENPSEQSRLEIFFSKEIFKGGVIRIHNAFVHDEEENPSGQSRLEIFFSKEIFKGGVIRIHNAFVHDEASTHSLEKKNGVSFSRRWVIGRAIFEKSCMNHR
nr:hypothetical protein [Tanacetum cinerariifolium]